MPKLFSIMKYQYYRNRRSHNDSVRKHGFSDSSKLLIRCIKESGSHDLVLDAQASYVE